MEEPPAPPPEAARPAPAARRGPGIAAVLAAVAALALAGGAAALALGGSGDGDPPRPDPPRPDPPPAPAPKTTWRAYAPWFGGYAATVPRGGGWSAPVESEEVAGRRYRAVIQGPGRLFALIDYTPKEPADFHSDYESKQTLFHPAFGSATRYISADNAEPLCQGVTCIDYIINDTQRNAGYAVLAGGGDFARVERVARRISNSLVYRTG